MKYFRNPVAVVLVLATFVASVFFWQFAQIDIAVARLFFDAQAGFTPAQSDWARFANDVARPLFKGLIALALGAGLLVVLVRLPRFDGFSRAYVFCASSILCASGIVVEGILKTFSGRARPLHIDLFGGDKSFSPAWGFTDQCSHNCSFVSGDVSGIAVLAALFVFVPARYRILFFGAIGFLTAATAYYRIALGKHFLSDTILAALITWSIVAMLYDLFYGTNGAAEEN